MGVPKHIPFGLDQLLKHASASLIDTDCNAFKVRPPSHVAIFNSATLMCR